MVLAAPSVAIVGVDEPLFNGATPRLFLFLLVTFTNTKYISDHIRAKHSQDKQFVHQLALNLFRT